MISSVNYKLITDKIHYILDILSNAESVAIDLQSTSTQLDLIYSSALGGATENNYFESMNQTLQAIETSANSKTSSNNMKQLVRALGEHIEARYDTIDDFLQEEGILVKQNFYDLSNSLGYVITSTYLE